MTFMLLFMALPLAAIIYVSWHVWVLLPLANIWKWLIIALGIACFLLLFLDLRGKLDSMPLPLARVLYEIGTSSAAATWRAFCAKCATCATGASRR